jgi:hypothetical protein
MKIGSPELPFVEPRTPRYKTFEKKHIDSVLEQELRDPERVKILMNNFFGTKELDYQLDEVKKSIPGRKIINRRAHARRFC